MIIFSVLLLIAFASGFFISQAQINNNTKVIRTQLLADCQLDKDIAEAPIPANATVLGRKLVKDFRNTYNAKCIDVYGPLKIQGSDGK